MSSGENKKQEQKTSLSEIISINDLKEMEFNQKELTPQQHLALKNYDRFRVKKLNAQQSEFDFQKTYMQLQAMANLSPYDEFLKEDYF
ncbi:MAG TPA: hypothetical protein VKZ45_11020 [Vicingaceae bacterium]|jgi:hypothetical protein|nr:hypothetical protein [Vicingaceae bacterium]